MRLEHDRSEESEENKGDQRRASPANPDECDGGGAGRMRARAPRRRLENDGRTMKGGQRAARPHLDSYTGWRLCQLSISEAEEEKGRDEGNGR